MQWFRSVSNVFRLRLLMPIRSAPDSSARGQVLRLVKLDQRSHSQFEGGLAQTAEPTVVQAFGDQQHGVGTGDARLDDLIGIDDEVFTQQGIRTCWRIAVR